MGWSMDSGGSSGHIGGDIGGDIGGYIGGNEQRAIAYRSAGAARVRLSYRICH